MFFFFTLFTIHFQTTANRNECIAKLMKGCAMTTIGRNLSIRLITSNRHERTEKDFQSRLRPALFSTCNYPIVKLSTCLECIWHWRAAAGTGDGDDGDATMQSAPLTRAKGNGAEAREMPLDRRRTLLARVGGCATDVCVQPRRARS